jgi:class 3 adenylate cyclase/ketosteroid isomerase-like protein
VNCTSCGRENRTGARFCGGCGASLAPRCPACGAAAEADARFCDGCGASLAAPAPDDRAARKVVTILFADLIGSTALQERLDPESVSRVMEAYHRTVAAPVEAHGGSVVQLLGDGVMCAFGVPRAGEDDALRAVRAAVAVQQAFRAFLTERPELTGRVGLRVALNTGEVVVSDDYAAGIGDPLNVAARLQQEAKDGDVLIGGSTQRLVASQVTLEPVGVFALKGRAEPVAAYRVVSLERPERAAAAAFVGRESELRRLRSVFDAAVAERQAKLAVVLGSPGLGKSRLLSELARSLGGRASVLVAQCPAAGGATFAPLAESLRSALDAAPLGDEAERSRIAAGVGAILAGQPAPPEETFFAVRRLLAALAAARPLVLAIDDLQWAEPLLLDLVEHLVQWGAGAPLLVLAAARPELRDVRSSLASPGGLVADAVTLGGLDAGAATQLAASVIGADALPAAVAGRVLAASEGNPLFLGELVRMLVNDGVLRREGDAWIAAAGLAGLEMPPTIQALLAARIERLRPEERLVLERAAVIGRQFSRTAVAHLLPRETRSELDARLEVLRRSELIEPDTDGGWFLGEPALRFHHVLIRDAAYRRSLRNTRADLHERFAEWLAERAGADSAAHDETIGWHLEQAFQHRREIGALDASARSLGARAARHLALAGRRALARDDVAPAASLLGRALDCLDADDPARAELALDASEALLAAGQVAPAAHALAELGRFAAGSERLRAWHTCFAGQLAVLSDPQALQASGEAVAAAAATLAREGDAAGEAKAHSVHAQVLAQLGKIAACEAALDRALAAARRAGDRRRANAVLAGAPVAALWGPSPVTRASGRCLDVVRVLRITQGAPAVEAVALRCQAVLETLRGRSEAARRMIASSRRMVEELGITQRVLEADVFTGLIELLEGDGAAAEHLLRPALEGLRAQGLGIDAAQAAALLGRALLAQGRIAEAEALSHESEGLAGDSFKAAIAWRCVRAEALAARGEHEAAVEVADRAVEIAAATDDLLDHADARHALAIALRGAGRADEAAAEEALAAELWQEKGATLLVERARAEAGGALARTRASEAPAPRTPRRVPETAATRCFERFHSAALSRDLDRIAALCADGLQVIHHPTGATIEREGGLRRWRLLLASEDLELSVEALATLGDRLALTRDVTSFSRLTQDELSFGAASSRYINLGEVNERGQAHRIEVFAEDRLGDAVVRFYQRHAELMPEGPERARAEAIARSVARWLRVEDGGIGGVVARAVEFADHRSAGLGAARGEALFRRGHTVHAELARDVSFRIDDVVELRPNAFLLRSTTAGIDRTSGGAFERPLLLLGVFGPDGLVTRVEWFDPVADADALARFDALVAPLRDPFANAATRVGDRYLSAWLERDWDAVIGSFAPGFELDDRRALVGVPASGADFVANQRLLFALASSRFESEVLATRGERLVLRRTHFSGEDGTGGRVEVPMVSVTETDETQRYAWQALFDPDAEDAAYAALDARYTASEGGRLAAWSEARAWNDAFHRRDFEGLAAQYARGLQVRDHRRLGWGTIDSTRYVELLRSLVELAPDARLRIEHVRCGSKGVLSLATMHGTRDGGPFELPSRVVVREVDAAGRLRRLDHYDLDQLDAAFARYRELCTGEDSSGFPLANAAARAQAELERAWRERRWSEVLTSFAPEVELDDRRALVGVRVAGDAFLDNLRLLFQMPSSAWRSEPLATRGERLALFRTQFYADPGGNAPIEDEHLSVVERDTDGRTVAIVSFDLDRLDAARAELAARYAAELASPARPARIENAATRSFDRFERAWAARDSDAIASLYAPDFRLSDRRRLVRLELGREELLDGLRRTLGMQEARLSAGAGRPGELLATRGERLALLRGGFVVRSGDVGLSEIEMLTLLEVDPSGQRREMVAFDPDAVAAAYEELDARYAGGEAAIHPRIAATMHAFLRAFASRDWDTLAAQFTPDLVVQDHRLLGWETLRGPDAYVRSLRGLVDLAPDASLRLDHIRIAERAQLWVAAWSGNREGGAFEEPWIVVAEHDAAGVVVRFDQYDVDRLDAALERFAALQPDPLSIPPNTATRASQRLHACFALSDTEDFRASFESLLAPSVRFDDRRSGVRLVGDRDTFVASAAMIHAAGSRPLRQVLATAGDRIALERSLWRNEALGTEVDTLDVLEVDGEGRLIASVTFDPEDRRSAANEMLVRFRGGEGARRAPSFVEFVLAMNAQDAARARAQLPDDFAYHDHRWTGLGRLGTADDYVASLAALWEQSPDACAETLYYVADAEHASLNVGRMFGTLRDGGEFETFLVRLARFREGRFVEVEVFEPEDLELARARFEELRPDPLEIPANAATRAVSERAASFAAGDWPALRALAGPGFVFEDRRRRALLAGGVDLWIQNLGIVASWPDRRSSFLRIATLGERVALGCLVYSMDEGRVEGEFLRLVEVDAEGRLSAWIHFDVEDRAAAFAEAQARFAAGEAAGDPGQAAIAVQAGAFTRHDWASLRACFSDDAATEDHRQLGLGSFPIDGWIDSLRAFAALAPDVSLEPIRILAWNERGRVSVLRVRGTREGGPFENVFVGLAATRGGRIQRYEFFDVGDAERALARFAELGAG